MNARQQQFVAEYLIDLNATQAAIRAGYSEKTAYSQGHDLLKNPEIQAAIKVAMDERAKRTEVTADRVISELAKVAFANVSDVTDWGVKEVAFGFDEDGRKLAPEDIGDATMVRYADAPFVKPINRDDLAPDIRSAVAEVGLTKDGFKVKMHDKNGALVTLARHLGLLEDKVNMKVSGSLAADIEEARRRVSAAP